MRLQYNRLFCQIFFLLISVSMLQAGINWPYQSELKNDVALWKNIFTKYSDATGENIDASAVEDGVNAEIDQLLECFKHTDTSFVIVTNEVGLGLVPASRMSRLYRDLLGWANQLLAEEVDEVYLMVAGLTVTVKPSVK